jgi:hypothetical protein
LKIVDAAIAIRDELMRLHPDWPNKLVWYHLYRAVIPRWDDYGRIERQEQAEQLRKRVRWRRIARRKRGRRKRPDGKVN